MRLLYPELTTTPFSLTSPQCREPYVREYLNKLREKKPVIYSGDLNVAHTDLDVYNFQAKHLLKQAGTTLREKEAFSQLLDSGFRDSLRLLYPGTACSCPVSVTVSITVTVLSWDTAHVPSHLVPSHLTDVSVLRLAPLFSA